MTDSRYFEQGTPEWYEARLHRFTSSEVHKLIPGARAWPGELTKTAVAYVFDKIADRITAGGCLEYRELNTREIEWGREHEETARLAYSTIMSVDVQTCGFFVCEDLPSFGGSPDGLVGEDGFIEIKCPYNSSVHARYLAMATPDDLLREKPEYYAQIQGNYLATGRRWCDFVSYDPRCANPLLAVKILRIPRDEEYIDRISEAVLAAVKYKQEITSRMALLARQQRASIP
jgi:exodeoxyribonuclease (lambda-induced)